MSIRIMIADDHAVVRDGLKMILESEENMQIVALAADGHEAVALAERCRPHVVIMDISMPGLGGIEAARLIRERLPLVKVMVLSMHHSTEHIYRALHVGVQGYLLKESAGSEVATAVRAVMKGNRFFGKGVEQPLEELPGKGRSFRKSPIDSLSMRERQILQLVVEGQTSAEIAEVLSLSPKSVETYRSRMMLKLGVTNIPTLVRFALQHGIIPAN